MAADSVSSIRLIEAHASRHPMPFHYFDSSRFITDLANGNICVVVGWAGGVMDVKKAADAAGNGRKIQYSIPKEGAPVWVESLVLLSDAPNHCCLSMDNSYWEAVIRNGNMIVISHFSCLFLDDPVSSASFSNGQSSSQDSLPEKCPCKEASV